MGLGTVLKEKAGEGNYGEWYHNAGIMIFAVISTHILTWLGGGIAMMVVVLAICVSYYDVSIRRTRRNARDDIQRELTKQRMYTDFESAEWMNHFLTRFWLIYEPVLSATIVSSVDQVLSLSTPAFLDSIRLTTFTLGTKAPRIDAVKTFAGTEEDVVVMDWKLNFTPNDVEDLTKRQMDRKVNPKIVLGIRVGKGVAGVTKDIVLEDLMFTGNMRIKLKLINTFPHVKTVDLSFMEKPTFDFVLKPIGFDINLIPALPSFIHNTVHSILGPQMYDPHTFTLDLEQIMSGAPIDTAIGVLQVTIWYARGLRGTKMGGGQPDPYVEVSISQRAKLATTKIKKSTSNPSWKAETHFVLINSLKDVLCFAIKDYNKNRADSDLGLVSFDLGQLEAEPAQEGVSGPVLLEGKPRGELKFDVNFYPVLKPLKDEEGVEQPVPETKSGILRLVVHQVKDITPSKRETFAGQLNPYARILLRGKEVGSTPVRKRTASPVFEFPKELIITDKDSAVVGVQIMDSRTGHDPVVGFLNIRLLDLLEAIERKEDWFPLKSCKTGRVRLTATWKGVNITGAINGAGGYTPPIGVLRLHFKQGKDLKNVEALTNSKSDPYMRVLKSGIVLARTHVVNNDLDPEWDEIVYVPVHSIKDNFSLQAMDYQNQGQDRSLGSSHLIAAELIAEGPDKATRPFIGSGKKVLEHHLKLDNGKSEKGVISFEAEFFPATKLRGVRFDAPENAIDMAAAAADLEKDDSASIIDVTATEASSAESEDEDVVRAMKDDMKRLADKSKKTKRTSLLARGKRTSKDLRDVNTNGLETQTENGSAPTSPTAMVSPQAVEDGITVPREVLLKTQSGILVINIQGGKLAKNKARLEILFDDGYWPTYSTEPSRGQASTWDEVGEAFIRELDYSVIWLKLNQAAKDSRDDVFAAAKYDMNEFLELCLDKPHEFVLEDDNGGNKSLVTLTAKYIPVDIQILPRESVNNMGILNIDLIEGKNLPAADRNGKSDPYVKFRYLKDGKTIFKSEIIKKNLNPVWNEKFSTQVESRTRNDLTLEVYDWDLAGDDDHLGIGAVQLTDLEPFAPSEQTVLLSDPKTGKKQGEIRLRILFTPQFISRTRTQTSTFGAAGRVATGLGGVVAGVGGAGVGVVGMGAKGVGKGIGGIGSAFRRGNKGSIASIDEVAEQQAYLNGADAPPVPPLPSGIQPAPLATAAEQAALGGAFGPINAGIGAAGQLTVTIAEATSPEPDAKVYVRAVQAGKEVAETGVIKSGTDKYESFTVRTAKGPCDLQLFLMKKKFGKDKELGETPLTVWQYIQPLASSPITTATASLQLSSGQGSLQVRLDWQASSVQLGEGSQVPPSPKGSSASIRGSRLSTFSRSSNVGN